MRDKGGGGGPKTPKICVTSFMDGPQGGEQGGDVPLQAGAGRLHGHHPVPQEADREETFTYEVHKKCIKFFPQGVGCCFGELLLSNLAHVNSDHLGLTTSNMNCFVRSTKVDIRPHTAVFIQSGIRFES